MPASRLALPCHPLTPDAFAVEAGVARTADGGLHFSFRLAGDLGRLRLPPAAPAGASPVAPARRDGLWRHTCCEAFVAAPGTAAYREFNFAPSGDWAAYAFAGYRQPAAGELALPPEPGAAPPPAISVDRDGDGLCLHAVLPAAWLPDAARGLAIGLSAVLEACDGTLSYRALRHAAPRPDFHRRDSFALFLPAPHTPS